jgi:hypothetical protein
MERANVTPLEAAEMILADYAGTLGGVVATLDIEGCQSVLVSLPGHQVGKPILLIRGSDEKLDWIQNFRFLPEPAPGDSVWWHRGFLHHAQIAYSWAKDKGVGLVIGHSLGASCVQIVATSLAIEGMGFASPKPLFAPSTMQRPKNELLVRNWCRTDDTICFLPPDGFSHVGETFWLKPLTRHLGEDHGIRHYVALLKGWAP